MFNILLLNLGQRFSFITELLPPLFSLCGWEATLPHWIEEWKGQTGLFWETSTSSLMQGLPLHCQVTKGDTAVQGGTWLQYFPKIAGRAFCDFSGLLLGNVSSCEIVANLSMNLEPHFPKNHWPVCISPKGPISQEMKDLVTSSQPL